VNKNYPELAWTIVGMEQGMADEADLWNGHAASHWIEMLDHPAGEVRWQAIDALRHIARPEQTVPLFAMALRRDSYWRVRALAVHAVYDLAFEEDLRPILRQAVIPLADALWDKSSHVSLHAAHALELLGSAALAAIPALREAIYQGDDELRAAAHDALVAISGGDASGNTM
jgi:HEAT repeat protein